jgi:hypothetical protein
VRVSNPYAGGPDVPNRVRGGLVALGVVLGVVATFVWMAVVLVVGISQENNPGKIPDWVVFVLFFLPLPLSILLLVFRRTRQAAAGFVMGLAIGVLVLAGLCSGLVVLPGLGA